MNSQNLKVAITHNHGRKQAFDDALALIRAFPIDRAIKEIQTRLDGCEDLSFTLDQLKEQNRIEFNALEML